MAQLYVARRTQRKGLFVPMAGTKGNPNLVFFLPEKRNSQVSPGQLDQLIRKELAAQGVTKESDVQAVVEKAEVAYEQRVKVAEATAELKRLMALKADGAKLMQMGYRRWKEVLYPKR